VTSVPFPGAHETIAAVATAPGRGALAVVRLSGPQALLIARRVVARLEAAQPRVAQLAIVHHPEDDSRHIDEALVTVFPRPHSYTGEDVVELSVHGGAITPTLVMGALLAAGARQALPGEFTRRAVANGRMDLLQAEAVGDLIDARSRMAHRAALLQLEGGLSQRAHILREAVLHLESLIAYDIDFPEEDEGRVDPKRVQTALHDTLQSLDELLGTADTGEVLRDGALVVIGGAPNAGKSSLFNALVGRDRAIVTDVPGTTRDAVEVAIEIGEWPVRLIDTAGLRDTTDVVERIGVEISERYLADADLVLLCAEQSADLPNLMTRVEGLTSASILAIRTKADLSDIAMPAPAPFPIISVSARSGTGISELVRELGRRFGDRFTIADREAPILTRDRHRSAVSSARSELLAFRDAWQNDRVPIVVAAVHLREASYHLSELIGTVDVEDVLDRVFSTFCVGK
jgi:tRNA modification GTPase